MTVTPDNLPHLWATVEFGLKFDHIRGVAFQPMFTSGRVAGSARAPRAVSGASPENSPGANGSSARAPKTAREGACAPLNTADIILSAVAQSSGKLQFDDF